MVLVTYEDQKDKDGLVIGQYAHFDKVVKTERQTLNKEELIKIRDKLEAEVTHYNEIINGMR